ncbi:MAG: hypothetical protein COA58_00915 [Bacteroidetes bacterium]|nr:MAG: hypothetical protein COA58_00915 [Bacteroidota bacterium]
MKKTLVLVCVVLFLGSCFTDITDTIDKSQRVNGIQWNPTIAVPLVYSRLGLKDVLEEVGDLEYIRVETDGSITLVYSDRFESKTAGEVIILDDQSYGETLTLSAAELSILNSAGSVVATYNRTLGYNFGSNEIDKILYKAGTMAMRVSTTLEHDVTFKLTIPEATSNGNTFSESVVANSTSLPNVGNRTVNLNGTEIDFSKTTQMYSEIGVEIEMTITKRGLNTIKPLETITFDFDLLNQEFSQLVGFFDPADFNSASDTLNLSLFSNNGGGSFTLADPRIKFILENSVGIPVEAKILNFDGTNSDNNTVALTGYPDPLPFPIVVLSEIGQTKIDSFSLNRNNSNLADYINNRPAKNFYEFDVNSTATGAIRHFVTDSSKVAAKIEIEVPLEGTAKDFILENSQPFTLELENVDGIKEVLIRLYTENGFPMDIATQLYFEDSTSNTVLDSLFSADNLILPAADVDGTGKVVSINPKTTDVVLNSASIDRLKMANRIRIRSYFNTLIDGGGTQPDVKFYEEYDLLLQLGVQAEVLINQDL